MPNLLCVSDEEDPKRFVNGKHSDYIRVSFNLILLPFLRTFFFFSGRSHVARGERVPYLIPRFPSLEGNFADSRVPYSLPISPSPSATPNDPPWTYARVHATL